MKEKVDIKQVDINKVKLAPYNPNVLPTDLYELLKKNILEFGLVQPLVVNKRSGNVVGGNHRLKVLRELDYKTITVAIVDLAEPQEIALNIALNRIHGAPDIPMLKDLLADLDTGGIDMELTGYDEINLASIFDYSPDFNEPPAGHSGTSSVIQYNIIFNTEQEQATWHSFLKFLQSKHTGLETHAERICAQAQHDMQAEPA